MNPEEIKKFAAIKARFDELAAVNYTAIQKGEFLRMIWAGIIPEVQWLMDQLIEYAGDPGKPMDASPILEPKKVKKVNLKKGGRLAKVAANKEFEISNDEGDL